MTSLDLHVAALLLTLVISCFQESSRRRFLLLRTLLCAAVQCMHSVQLPPFRMRVLPQAVFLAALENGIQASRIGKVMQW